MPSRPVLLAAIALLPLAPPAARAQWPAAERPPERKTLLAEASSAARGAPVVVHRVPGYACMAVRDGPSPVPILADPAPGAARVAFAALLMAVREPAHVEHGYAEILRRNGKPGWIEAAMLTPSRGNCSIVRLPNGAYGTGR